MGTRLVIANLLKREGCHPRFRFEEVKLSAACQEQVEDAAIAFYRLNMGPLGYGGELSASYLKAWSKGVNAMALLTKVLNGKVDYDYDTMKKESLATASPPSVESGNTIIVVEETFSDRQIAIHSWNLFLSIQFHFPPLGRTPGLLSTQHLQISSPTLRIDDSLFTDQGVLDFDHIELVSGVCIFNGETLRASLSNSPKNAHATQLHTIGPTFQMLECTE